MMVCFNPPPGIPEPINVAVDKIPAKAFEKILFFINVPPLTYFIP